ncbi:hypothetical protein LDENG_00104310 [Lucifuga dentata]|nr:hypothetical protein LDENG_00104310 [Lucifuga dentata]
MSDWEDEYVDGVASSKAAAESAPPQWKLSCKDHQKENVCFDVRNSSSGRCSSRKEGGDGRSLPRFSHRGGFGRWNAGCDRSASAPPVTMTVENASVGRIIGRGGAKIRELEESTGARIKIKKGDYEGEVVIFGSSDAQQKVKEMIKKLVADDNSQFQNGTK